MSRYFTLAEALRMLPEVKRIMGEGLELFAAHQDADSKLQDGMRRIVMLGGSIADRDSFAELRLQRDTAASALNHTIENIHSLGCQVKDLSLGLVDFPTLYRDEEVLLCWRFGEETIEFWHGLEDGFGGRKAIDQEFLDNHRGDPIH
jgi:hypothetical protein